jgi:hypothetical protein
MPIFVVPGLFVIITRIAYSKEGFTKLEQAVMGMLKAMFADGAKV